MKNLQVLLILVIVCFAETYNAYTQNITVKKVRASELIDVNRPADTLKQIHATVKIGYEKAIRPFTLKQKSIDKTWTKYNKAYLNHPDAGFADQYVPSKKAVELFEKRTKYCKYYVDKDSTSKFYSIQSNGALHYPKDGQWLTIDDRLEQQGNRLYEASRQEEPVGFDVGKQKTYIKSLQGTVYFNNWTLYGRIGKQEVQLADANWANYTAGDDGIYITNIFPGIDAQMKTGRGTIKTNFIIRQNQFAQYTALVFKDKFEGALSDGFTSSNTTEADYELNGQKALHLSPAIVYAENNAERSIQSVNYNLTGNEISLAVEKSYLDKYLSTGNVILDPLVSTTNSIAQIDISGSMDCGSYTNSCNYNLIVPTPAAATITGVYFKFGFQTVGSALNRNGYWTITSGSHVLICGANPDSVVAYNSPGTTSTLGKFSDITPAFLSDMPSPSCTSQNVSFTLGFFNNICDGTHTGCSNNYIKANQPFVVMIEGHNVEMGTITSDTICKGGMASISASAKYGVAPYTYLWSNGATTSSIQVSPTSTTSYTVTITDQCGNKATGSGTVTVRNTIAPTTPVADSNSPVCEGGTLNLTASNVTGAVYSWSGPNEYTSSIQNLSINNAKTYYSGNYIVTASLNGCTSLPDTVNVNVKATTVAVSISASTQTICEGSKITFTATPTNGGAKPAYLWYINGVSTGSTESIYTSTSLSNKDVVKCTMVSNAGGCIPSTPQISNSIIIETINSDNYNNGFVKDIDGNTYKAVTIGSQIWMSGNLKTTKYKDGSQIPNITDNNTWETTKHGAYCNYKNDTSYVNTYGRLYNWYALTSNKLCPTGWHTPSDNDWNTLQVYLGGTSLAGGKLKSTGTLYWGAPNTDATNESGFSALPGGYRMGVGNNGDFLDVKKKGAWWSTSQLCENCDSAYYWVTSSDYSGFYKNYAFFNSGFSVRCLKDDSQSNTLAISLKTDNTAICKGDSAILSVQVCSGTPPYTYKWNCNSSNQQSVTVYPSSNTQYIVTVVDSSGLSNIDTVFVDVKQPSFSNQNIVANGSYRIEDSTIYQSGTYHYKLRNAAGCDSIVTVNLTIKRTIISVTNITICQGDSYFFNGITYFKTGVYVDSLKCKNGSDSLAYLKLTVLPTSSTTKAIICQGESYNFNGKDYATSGTYMAHLTNNLGCDSTATLILNVAQPSSSLINTSICQGYTYNFNGASYSDAGTYTSRLTNWVGCDSMVTLNLSVNSSSYSTLKDSFCRNSGYVYDGATYNETGTYTVHLTNAAGCDSMLTLLLTAKEPSFSTIRDTIDEGQAIHINGTDYTQSGTYIQHLTNTAGCDSTINVIVTIHEITITIPKYLTPNGDGYHDTWEIGNIDLFPNADITIFDRFGKPLAHYKGKEQGWNGQYKGKLMPSDDYWYHINLHKDGKTYTGHVTLIR